MRLVPTLVFTTRPAPVPLYLAWCAPTTIPRQCSTEPTKPLDILIVFSGGQVSEVDLVSQKAAYGTETIQARAVDLGPAPSQDLLTCR